jgi:signal transduction histidine kinase/ActR/RegA family two-component response regulator
MSTEEISTTRFELTARILNMALKVSAIFVPGVAGILIFQVLLNGNLNFITIVLSIYCLGFPALWLVRKKLSFNTLGVSYLCLMLLLAFMLQLRGGLTTSTASVQIIVFILSGMLFGSRGVFACLGLSLLSFSVAGFSVVNGLVPPLSETLWDAQLASTWFRAGIILAVFGSAAAMSVSYALSRLEQETARLQASLSREKTQRLALEQAELEKEATRKALAEAQRVEAIGRLASGVAHDFNNSLTVITGAAELAEMDSNLPERVKKALATIKKAAFKSADLTRSLMVLGRKDPARVEVIRTDYLIFKLKNSLERLLPEDIEFSITAPESRPILIDRNQTERAIINLVLNAKDAIENGGKISITCDAIEIDESHESLIKGSYAKISVIDDGQGMSDDVKEHIFEPFYTTKATTKGTGMGLSLVKSFISDANGDIQINTKVGEGTEVALLFPVTGEQETVKPYRSVVEQDLVIDSKYKVLVVEDNPEVLATTSETLRSAGFKVFEADNGDTAMSLLETGSEAIDLLCIDGVIPGASSSAVIAKVQDDHPDSRIVICSGYVEEELVLRGIETGEFAYVRKPFLKTELLGCIQEELGLQQTS